MNQNLFEYTLLALWSLAVGAFLCAVYDIFRVFRLEKRKNAFLLFFEDIVFSLICSFSMLVLFFNLSYGKMRFYAFAFALVGFLLWRFTISRIYIFIIKRIISIYKRFLSYIKQKLGLAIFWLTRYIKTLHYCKTAVGDIKKFHFEKRKEVNNVTKEDCTDQFGH